MAAPVEDDAVAAEDAVTSSGAAPQVTESMGNTPSVETTKESLSPKPSKPLQQSPSSAPRGTALDISDLPKGFRISTSSRKWNGQAARKTSAEAGKVAATEGTLGARIAKKVVEKKAKPGQNPTRPSRATQRPTTRSPVSIVEQNVRNRMSMGRGRRHNNGKGKAPARIAEPMPEGGLDDYVGDDDEDSAGEVQDASAAIHRQVL